MCGYLNDFGQQLGPDFETGNFLWSLSKEKDCLVLRVENVFNFIPGANESVVVC
jgi:hypothetical protein